MIRRILELLERATRPPLEPEPVTYRAEDMPATSELRAYVVAGDAETTDPAEAYAWHTA